MPVVLGTVGVLAVGWGVYRLMSTNRRLSVSEIAQLLHDAGFRGDALITGIAVVLSESGGWTAARNTNRHKDGGVSEDRGLWQINSRHHPQVSDSQADDPEYATRYAYRLWKGSGWSPWYGHSQGGYKKYLALAEQTVQRMGLV